MQKNTDSEKILLLDTHVWIWLMNGDEELQDSKTFIHIEQAARSSNLRVSIISVWEVAMLEAKGRITLSMDCLDWVNRALSAPGISPVAISPEIAVSSARLPGKFHGDPADRIIVATARKTGAYVVTRDLRILEYARQNFVDAISI